MSVPDDQEKGNRAIRIDPGWRIEKDLRLLPEKEAGQASQAVMNFGVRQYGRNDGRRSPVVWFILKAIKSLL